MDVRLRVLGGLAAAFAAAAVGVVFFTLHRTADMVQSADRIAAGLLGFIWALALLVTAGAFVAMAVALLRARVAAAGRHVLYEALIAFADAAEPDEPVLAPGPARAAGGADSGARAGPGADDDPGAEDAETVVFDRVRTGRRSP